MIERIVIIAKQKLYNNNLFNYYIIFQNIIKYNVQLRHSYILVTQLICNYKESYIIVIL